MHGGAGENDDLWRNHAANRACGAASGRREKTVDGGEDGAWVGLGTGQVSGGPLVLRAPMMSGGR